MTSQRAAKEMFKREISAVFVRWWEESDLDEVEMAEAAMDVIDKFAESSVEFDAEFNIGENEEGDNVGLEDDQEY